MDLTLWAISVMDTSKLILFSTSVLTAYGSFNYQPITPTDAKELVHEFQRKGKVIESAIGHQPTADLLSVLLEFDIPKNRIESKQSTVDLGLVFKLNRRPPEGKVLTREEIETIGYEFGLLLRCT